MAIPRAHTIDPKERCFRLVEVNHLTPSFKSLHRYQQVYVIRNDALAIWEHDLGPSSNFKASEVVIPGAVEIGRVGEKIKYEIVETVANLQAYAKEHRARGAAGLSPEEIGEEMLKSRRRVQAEAEQKKYWNPSRVLAA